MLNILQKLVSKGNYKDHLYALILAGGGGTRLWPKSKNKTPKQFLPLFFENQTLTQLRDTLLPKLISGEVRLKGFREESITN